MPTSNSQPESADPAIRTAEFVRLLTQHERRVYGYILSLVPRWADADEILQETNVRLWEQFDSYRAGADFGAWACTIAHYQVLTFRNRTERERAHFSQQFIDLVMVEARGLEAEADVRLSALSGCLDKLLASQRELLRQCYGGKSTLKEVAERLGRPVAATYKSLSRIRQLLHDCIESRLRKEEA